MSYTADITELAIRNENKRLKVEHKHWQAQCHAVLVDWGCKRWNEVNREVDIKPPCTAQTRSGEALEANPGIPHISLTEDEYGEVSTIITGLGGMYSKALKKKYVDNDRKYFDSKVHRIYLGQAITKFSQMYKVGS